MVTSGLSSTGRITWRTDWPGFTCLAIPPGHLDHINCVRTDNRIANLRPATHTQNMHNQNLRKTNKSGHKGVSWCNKTKKWHSQCMFERKKYHLGKFENIEDAIQAVESFRNARHGEFANHGQTASKE
jgi:hypothetical protein